MKREHSLRRRLRSLETLSEAVGAMKSLSAHHFRLARAALPAARAYRTAIEQALAAVDFHQPESPGGAAAILLIAADLGLCSGYNSQLASAAVDHCRSVNAQRVYCVGHRPLSVFNRSSIAIHREYRSPTSVAGLTELLLRLGEDLLVDHHEGLFGTLDVISARFDGIGEFTPTCTRLLPVDAPEPTSNMKPSPYVTADHLVAVAIREYLYIRLFQAALDSLASEHGARLVATESAGEWLTAKAAYTRRQLAAIHRESATQEVLDIASAARPRRIDAGR